MGDCRIRFANYDDIPEIMRYIDTYWKKGHILATNRELFEWQYIDNGRVNFVIGINDENNIQGILGFVPYGADENKDIALALWKANKSESFLGIKLILFLKKEEKHRHIICPGINMRTTSKIYMKLGMNVDVMNQWYRLRNNGNFIIAKIENPEIPEVNGEQFDLKYVSDADKIADEDYFDSAKNNVTPFKTKKYFIKRYFNHPIYNYLVYTITDDAGDNKGLVVLRVQECNGSKVLRFVDFIGEQSLLPKITNSIDLLMNKYQVEYIDMYEAGMNETVLMEGGWKKVKESGNIIPNYFAPYEQSIVDIYYCSSDENALIFRGDGDQDRPN